MLIAGCATTGFNTQTYTVKSGDTLYFIAWKYRLDPTQLAAWNNLSAPYTIYPGDRIQINPYNAPSSAKRSNPTTIKKSTNKQVHTVRKGDTLFSIARQYNIKPSQLAGLNEIYKPYTIYPGDKLRLKGSVQAPSTRPVKRSRVAPPKVRIPGAGLPNPTAWHWPAVGKVVKGFKGSQSTQQGIDIAGQKGQKVLAAAAGEVVYSGEGPALYGQMVIIKHSDAYLSAYGYNSGLLVKEGDKVKAKQPIATMGQQVSSQPQLHFEIRKYGKPVNPTSYLPKRS